MASGGVVWQEQNRMSFKLEFIEQWLDDSDSMTNLCERGSAIAARLATNGWIDTRR